MYQYKILYISAFYSAFSLWPDIICPPQAPVKVLNHSYPLKTGIYLIFEPWQEL